MLALTRWCPVNKRHAESSCLGLAVLLMMARLDCLASPDFKVGIDDCSQNRLAPKLLECKL